MIFVRRANRRLSLLAMSGSARDGVWGTASIFPNTPASPAANETSLLYILSNFLRRQRRIGTMMKPSSSNTPRKPSAEKKIVLHTYTHHPISMLTTALLCLA